MKAPYLQKLLLNLEKQQVMQSLMSRKVDNSIKMEDKKLDGSLNSKKRYETSLTLNIHQVMVQVKEFPLLHGKLLGRNWMFGKELTTEAMKFMVTSSPKRR